MWKKIVAPLVLVVALWVAVSSLTTYYIHWLLASHSRVLAENVSTIQDAADMQERLWTLHSMVLDTTPGNFPTLADHVASEQRGFAETLDRAAQTAITPEEQLLIASIGKNFGRYREYVDQHLREQKPGRPYAPPPSQVLLPLARAVAEPAGQLMDVNRQLLEKETARSEQIGGKVNAVRIVSIIVGPTAGVLLGLWVARGVQRSLARISITLRDAAGDGAREVGQLDVSPSADLPGLQEQVEVVVARLREMMEELRRAESQAMRAERLIAVGELATGLAHELRNPLTSVKLLIQTAAQRHPERPLSERQLTIIQEEVARMESTIQALLDFARPRELQRRRYDVRETLTRAVGLVDGRARQAGVTCKLALPPTPVLVDADPEQLHQVFVNLLINGIEAMRQGGELTVALDAEAGDDGWCRIRVLDAGPGIAEPMLSRLFEPFATNKERGTGLGLAISQRIVEHHAGTIVAENRAQGGAAVTVRLPVRPSPAAQPARGEKGPATASAPVAS